MGTRPVSPFDAVPAWVLSPDVPYADWSLHKTHLGSRISYDDWRRGVRPPGYKPTSLAKARTGFNAGFTTGLLEQAAGLAPTLAPVAKSAKSAKKGSNAMSKSIKKAVRANARAATPSAKLLERELRKRLRGYQAVQKGVSLADLVRKAESTDEADAIVRLARARAVGQHVEKGIPNESAATRDKRRLASEVAKAEEARAILSLHNARTHALGTPRRQP